MSRILLLVHSFNSLSQRIHVELSRRGHELSVELDINDERTAEAVQSFAPDLVLAPFLKRRIEASVWQQYPCLVVHPGIPGDGGPSALDHAILDQEATWGVTVFQATADYDAGPVWAWRPFSMRDASKSSLYRNEVTEAATLAVLDAVERFEKKTFQPRHASNLETRTGHWRDAVKQRARRVDWINDATDTVLRKINSADGNPGLMDRLADLPCRIYDAHRESFLRGRPGELIAKRHHAVCRATRDGAVWIGHIKADGDNTFKLPATPALGNRIQHLPTIGIASHTVPVAGTFQDIRYRESGEVGSIDFDFYNGAMGTDACKRLLAAFDYAASRPTRVIVLKGGTDFWSNGIDLNVIEAAESPADESWRNINAMDDLCEAIIRDTDHIVIAAMRGNAGAGGCFLALTADTVMARDGIVLNPHYKNMGNLYGSEFWTYLLPTRCGEAGARRVMSARLPIDALEAKAAAIVDIVGAADHVSFDRQVAALAAEQATPGAFERLIESKRQRRAQDEAARPLAAYRKDELDHTRLNFYGFDPSYHVARYRFVHRTPHAWTPLYLAPHRRIGWQRPAPSPARAA